MGDERVRASVELVLDEEMPASRLYGGPTTAARTDGLKGRNRLPEISVSSSTYSVDRITGRARVSRRERGAA